MKQDRSEAGSAAVEFALIIPVIALLCCAVIDYGNAVNLGTELRNAARVGAQYAIANSADINGVTWAVQNATKEPLTPSDITLVTSTDGKTTYPYYCTCSDGNPDASNQQDCVSAQSNVAPCNGTKKYFVSVTTSLAYTPILPYPGLPSSIPVAGSAVMQIQ